jgi:replicative DNA helicase
MELKLNLDEYENVIVYKSLTDERFLTSVIDIIKPEYFKDKNIKVIFNIIKAFYEKNNSIPTITELKTYINSDDVKEAFKIVLRNFSNIDKNLNEEELIGNTERYIKERAIYSTMLEVAEDVSSGKIDTSFILDKFEKSCNVNLKTNIGLDLFKNFNAVVEDLNTDKPTISSQWKWLDEKIDGGFLQNGRALYVFAGETNVGKSIFLGNIACNIANQGKTVLIVTLEMSELVYAKRLSSNITKIPMRSLRSESLTLKQQIEEISTSTPGSKIIIKEFPPSTVTVHQIQSFIKTIQSKGIHIDAIVVDYINLVKSTIGNNSYERIKYATESLRALSYVFECPIITATQLNRSGYNVNNPGLDTIGESMGLAATADVIISIFQDEEDKELGIVKMAMMKNRFGAKFGTTSLRMDYNTLTVSEDESLMNQGDQSSITNTLTMLSNKS